MSHLFEKNRMRRLPHGGWRGAYHIYIKYICHTHQAQKILLHIVDLKRRCCVQHFYSHTWHSTDSHQTFLFLSQDHTQTKNIIFLVRGGFVWRFGIDTRPGMLWHWLSQRNVRSKFQWFTELCNSHYVSHFAAFFIDTRAKRSTVESRRFFVFHTHTHTQYVLLWAHGAF